MKGSLSDEEIRAIYRKMNQVEESEGKEDEEADKVHILSLAVKKALGLVGY